MSDIATRELAAQMYQVVGSLAFTEEVFDDPETIRALDYLHSIASGEKEVDYEFLPFRLDNETVSK
ncbi:MAG: hypothetical protein ABFS03_00790 [Chloroflexota bacterium]